jgi:cytochrome c
LRREAGAPRRSKDRLGSLGICSSGVQPAVFRLLRKGAAMNSKAAVVTIASLLVLVVAGRAQAEVDPEAARALAKKNDCFKCHAVDKAKKAPAYQRIASRLKTKPDAVEVIVEHITSGRMVQLEDGTDEKHRIIDTRDPGELRNLALWILSL